MNSLLDILQKKTDGGQGHTSRELSQLTGIPISSISRTIKKLHLDGKIGVGRKPVKTILGSIRMDPSYWLLEQSGLPILSMPKLKPNLPRPTTRKKKGGRK